mmetsp:Transcript_70963/g.197147  ORF Transcript_70963/g.197147 Transcript_70963/m.197147 type:complete len:220 (+) Transcript_70963:156-815(+)|eukprot:CAMPEP_0117515610 /NCGR_PEP_ID=MMETSP0784-20121206/30669_1 /TAXON_ID=39447 /ORGANISM="" /LENGTH=219 /DNA_ID=CAMNT_0005311433 /DNA_START=140 /DNA_END=799 /DNA_ORIENTATION=+
MPTSARGLVALAAWLAAVGRAPCGGLLFAEASYFHVREGEEKCFIETVPEHQVLTVKYRHINNPGVACMLVFKDPRQTQVFSKRVGPDDSEQGKTAYMAQRRGDHRVCVQCQNSNWFQTTQLKWELSVDVGDTEFSKNPATAKDFHGIERSVLGALARAEAISAENDYEKIAEMDFRNASERMNSHIVFVALFIVALEFCLCVWQIWHLRSFFRREKLI